MTFHIPAWAPIELGASFALPAASGAGGRVVAVVASEASMEAGWAGQVTVALAQGWSAAGARVVVADAGLDRPQLHTAMDTSLDEGLTDALRWGASVKRVARRIPGHDFFAILAGTAVADGAAVLDSPRWPALCGGFVEAGVTLAVLVPAEDACRDGVLAQANEAVVLCGPREDAGALLGPWTLPVLAVLGMEDAAEEVRAWGLDELDARGDGEEAEEPVGFGDPMAFLGEQVAGDEGRQGEGALSPADPLDPPTTVADPLLEAEAEGADGQAMEAAGSVALEEPASSDEVPPAHEPVPTFEEIVEDTERPVPAAPKAKSRLPLVVLLLLLVAVVVAAYLGYVDIPGITPTGGEATEAPVPEAMALAATVPVTEQAPVLAYSVALGAFQDADAAKALMMDLREKVPGVVFHTTPVLLDGNVMHRVLAGAAADSAGAATLAARVAGGAGLDPSSWVARWTPLAFHIGEADDAMAAEARVQALEGRGVGAYVLAVPFSDGSIRYRVYAGAYADASEASYLSGLLEENDLGGSSLADRTGRLPE